MLGKGTDKGLVDLVNACALTSPIEGCFADTVVLLNIAQRMKEAGLVMVDGPCDDKENIWSDIVEGIGECLDLPQQDCACPFTAQHSSLSTDSSPQITVSSTVTKGATLISLEDKTFPLSHVFDTELQNRNFIIDDKGQQFFLLKKPDEQIFSDDQSGLPLCAPQKKIFKICVRSEQRLPIIDSGTGKHALKNLEYKFAVQFGLPHLLGQQSAPAQQP